MRSGRVGLERFKRGDFHSKGLICMMDYYGIRIKMFI